MIYLFLAIDFTYLQCLIIPDSFTVGTTRLNLKENWLDVS